MSLIPRTVVASFVALASLAPVACSSDGGEGAGTADPDTGRHDAGPTAMVCHDDGAIDITGRWAALARYGVTLRIQQGGVVTTCPIDQHATTDLLVLFDVASDPSDPARIASVRAYPCFLTLPTVTASVGDCNPAGSSLLTVAIPVPDTFTTHIADIPPAVAGAQMGGARGADAVTFDMLRFTWGTRSTSEALPNWQFELPGCGPSAADVGRSGACEVACVDACEDLADDDGDGLPGVTLHVCGTTEDDVNAHVSCNPDTPTVPGVTLQGHVAMVLRSEFAFAGTARSSCELTGPFASNTTYGVVGGDVYLTNAKVAVASALKSLPLFDDEPDASLFRAIRIDGRYGTEDWNAPLDADPAGACAMLRARQNELR